MIPAKAGPWSVILSDDPAIAANDRDPKRDVVTIKVAPAALPAPRERLAYLFTDTQDDRTSLDMEWERVRIRVPITVTESPSKGGTPASNSHNVAPKL